MREMVAEAVTPDEHSRTFAERWLGDPKRFWRLAALLLGTMAALKGIRWPSTWAETQAQLNYSHGFIKRGLLGTLYAPLHGNHDRALAAIFLVELVALYALLAMLTWRAKLEERFGDLSVAAVFASSYGITFLAHLIGYNDIVNACLTISLLLIRDARRRFWAALVVVPVALLVHESFLFAFFPVVMLSFVVEAAAETAGRKRAAVYAAMLALLAGGGTLWVARHGLTSFEQMSALRTEALMRVDFKLRWEFYFVLVSTTADNVRNAFTAMTWPGWRILLGISLAVLLPPLLLLAHWLRRMLAGQKAWLKATTVVAAAGPLLLNFVGFDVVRWNVLCLLATYLALLMLAMHLPKGRLVLSAAERNLVLLVIAVSMASGYGLFDGAAVQMYPFFPGWLNQARWGF